MSDVVARLRMRLDREAGMRQLDETVLKYGHANGQPWSFKDHEFQREIIRDTSSRISVRKCSQVGLSEIMVQKLLAMAASLRHVRIIFTLPTKEMATSFSRDRVDGAIDQSDFYSGLVEKANNSAAQKKIGSCMVYLTGTFGSNSAISIPAEVVISDEVDFSSQIVLGKLNSRLRHAQIVDEFGNRGLRYYFSTPTVDGFGIDAEFQKGSQKYYQVKCKCCNHWQVPTFNQSFRVKGFDDAMEKFSREDAHHLVDTLDQTKMHCEKCDADLFSSLIDPDCREWVALHPQRNEQSYQVSPWDLPTYNTPNAIVKQVGDYPLKSDFYNFVLGIPFSDASNSFITDDLYKMTVRTVDPIGYLAGLVMQSTVIGLDVGKICHMVVAVPMGKKMHVIWAEKIKNTRDLPAAPEIVARYDYFKCAFMCVDSGPDITLVNTLIKQRDIKSVVYVRNINGPKFFEEKTNEPVINVDRTKALTFLLDKHNNQDILYPKNDSITNEIFEHLKTTKKIRRQNADGSITELFTATSTVDHYCHALLYTMVAAEVKFGLGYVGVGIFAPVSVTPVTVGKTHKEEVDMFSKYMVW